MADSIDVNITIGFDASDLERQLTDTEAKLMRDYRNQMLAFIDRNWVGWQYKNIPPSRQGRSGEAWTGFVQTTEGIREIIIENRARSYYGNKPYAGYVKRVGSAVEEFKVVRRKLLQSFVPALIEDLESEIARNLDTPGPAKKVRKNKSSTKISLDLEG